MLEFGKLNFWIRLHPSSVVISGKSPSLSEPQFPCWYDEVESIRVDDFTALTQEVFTWCLLCASPDAGKTAVKKRTIPAL